ncbi:MAG: hypothetical protein ACLFSC_00550 [Wenzhouxiangella sp.]
MSDRTRLGPPGEDQSRCGGATGRAMILVVLGVVLMVAGLNARAAQIFADRFESLPAIEVSAESVQSLERVGIDAWPQGWTGLEQAEIEFVNVPGSGSLPVEQDEAGWFFHAPFHPDTPELGGSVQLRARLGGLTSAAFTLDVGALPDAPGAFAALVASLEAHIDAFAQRRGSSFAEIAALSFENTPSGLFPLKYAQSFVRAEQNANSLARLAAGDSSFLSAEESRLLDQIAGYVGLDALIQVELDAIADLDPAALNGSGARAGTSARACIDAGPVIGTAFELSRAMREAKFAELAVTGAPGNTLNQLGITLALGSAIPVYGKAFQALGAGTAAWQASRKMFAGLNPSRFESIRAEVERPRFEEDSEETGSYRNIEVVAASTGWIVDQAIFDAIVTVLGASASAANVQKISDSILFKDVLEGGLNAYFSLYLGEQSSGVVSFCPQTWTVDISLPDYSEGRSVLGHFDVDTSNRSFRPLRAEEDFLSISPIPSKFGQETIDVDFPIGVDLIEVTATPRIIEVETPGEVVNITATIDNAVVPTLFWDPGQGTWDDGQGIGTNEPATRPLRTPTNPDDYPFYVTVESASRRGLRASGEPVRSDQALVRFSKLVVSPGSACVKNGESESFSATLDGMPAEVIWSLEDSEGQPSTLGSVSSSGLYTAPNAGSGSVRVVATSVDNAQRHDFGIVEVGPCLCYWALTIAGEGAWSGQEAGHGFQLSQSPPTPGFRLVYLGETTGGTAESTNSAIAENVTGAFSLDTFFFSNSVRAYQVAADLEGSEAILNIDENVDNVTMTGTINGVAVYVVDNGETLVAVNVPFDMTFRSAGMDGSCEDDF